MPYAHRSKSVQVPFLPNAPPGTTTGADVWLLPVRVQPLFAGADGGLFKDHPRIGYHDTARLLTDLKQQPETAFLQDVSNVCLQQALRNLEVAFRNFFQGRAHYPTFKKKRARQSARYMSNGFSYRDGQIKLAKQDEPLAIRWSRALPPNAIPSSVTISKDTANRYFISLLVEETIAVLPVVNRRSGLDLGLTHAVITSHGQKFNHPRYLRKQQGRLKRAQKPCPGNRKAPRIGTRHG